MNDYKIYPLSDNSGYTFIWPDSTSITNIYKYTFSPASTESQKINYLNFGYGSLMISDDNYFMFGKDISDPIIHMCKLKFGNTVVDWDYYFGIQTNWMLNDSRSLLSQDGSSIYLFFTFGIASDYRLYFIILSKSTGSASSLYKSNSSLSSLYGICISGDYIVVAVDKCAVIYTISTSSFVIKQFSGNGLFSIAIEPSSGRLTITGQDSINNGYTTKLVIESFGLNTDFTTSIAYSMDPPPSGEITIYYESLPQTIDSKTSTSITTGGYQSELVTYIKGDTTTSDFYFQIVTQTVYVAESTTVSIALDIPCSRSGLSPITYSILNYGISSLPSWASFDSSLGTLTIKAPIIDADKEYDFYVVSTISGLSPIKKLIKLKITKCLVQNCKICSSSNGMICSICNYDYTLTSGLCIGGSTTAKSLGATTISSIGITIGVTSTTSFMDNSSISIIWSIINHVQLLVCLIMLTRSFIPQDVKTVIQGFKFFINVFIYVPVSKITFINSLFSNFDFDLTYRMFNDLGMTSDSSVYNTYPLVGMIFCIIFIHICLRFALRLLPRIRENGRCACLVKLFKWAINNSYTYMTFGYYIRSFLEIYQFIFICSIYEIYLSNTTGTFYILSLTYSFVVVIICCMITAFSFFLILISYRVDEGSKNLFQEFFHGIKQSKISRTYVVAFIIRRTVFIILLICLMSVPSKVVTCILASLQFVFAIYIAILRPFIDLKGNIIEIVNEVYFFILIFSLIFLNQEADWNSTNTSIYIWVLSSNSIVVFFIILVNRIIAFAKWIRNKCSRPSTNTAQINQAVVTPKPSVTNITSKLEIDENTKKMHKSTPNFYKNKIQEESKHDLSINCSVLPMMKIDELSQYEM